MRRFVLFLAIAAVGCALAPSMAQAQVVYVQPARVYAPPVVVAPTPVVTSYYLPQSPSTVTYPSYSYYSAPAAITYSAPAPVVTYAAPAVVIPAGHYETRSYYGFGILRPRGLYTETYFRPY